MPDLPTWLGLAAAVFAAGVLDSIAGGGGLLSLPAFLAAGYPPTLALGTNKLVAVNATLTSMIRYARAGLVRPEAVPLAAVSFAGSLLGASVALEVPPPALRIALLALLPLSLAVVLWQSFHPAVPRLPRPGWLWAGAAALGVYDGFFGPGTGTFLIALLTAAGGMELAGASGSAKLLNFGSNLGAVLLFANRGSLLPLLALSLVPVIVAGAWLGASLAVRRGAPMIRGLLTATVLGICSKLAWDLWKA